MALKRLKSKGEAHSFNSVSKQHRLMKCDVHWTETCLAATKNFRAKRRRYGSYSLADRTKEITMLQELFCAIICLTGIWIAHFRNKPTTSNVLLEAQSCLRTACFGKNEIAGDSPMKAIVSIYLTYVALLDSVKDSETNYFQALNVHILAAEKEVTQVIQHYYLKKKQTAKNKEKSEENKKPRNAQREPPIHDREASREASQPFSAIDKLQEQVMKNQQAIAVNNRKLREVLKLINEANMLLKKFQ